MRAIEIFSLPEPPDGGEFRIVRGKKRTAYITDIEPDMYLYNMQLLVGGAVYSESVNPYNDEAIRQAAASLTSTYFKNIRFEEIGEEVAVVCKK